MARIVVGSPAAFEPRAKTFPPSPPAPLGAVRASSAAATAAKAAARQRVAPYRGLAMRHIDVDDAAIGRDVTSIVGSVAVWLPFGRPAISRAGGEEIGDMSGACGGGRVEVAGLSFSVPEGWEVEIDSSLPRARVTGRHPGSDAPDWVTIDFVKLENDVVTLKGDFANLDEGWTSTFFPLDDRSSTNCASPVESWHFPSRRLRVDVFAGAGAAPAAIEPVLDVIFSSLDGSFGRT